MSWHFPTHLPYSRTCLSTIPTGQVKLFSLSVLKKENTFSKDLRMCSPEELPIINVFKLEGFTLWCKEFGIPIIVTFSTIYRLESD